MNDMIDDPSALAWWLRSADRSSGRPPDFLVIAPPKTGSTWLADNLRHHPDAYIPPVKEVKYFSSWFKHLDLDWYFDHFQPGQGRVTGEASPSYAPLPLSRIRLIQRLMPRVKLIFLMRNPIDRAWSHARHNYRYRETNFAGCDLEMHDVTDQQWLENLSQDWSLTSGDYLGQLRRWLAVFPKEQVLIHFYESIASEPEQLLREILVFLGLRTDVDLSQFPIHERILPGLAGDMSIGVRNELNQILHTRTQELVRYIRDELALTIPEAWQSTLSPLTSASLMPEAFARACDDLFLARVVAAEEQFPSATYPIENGYRGYHIVLDKGQFFALCESLGRVWPAELSIAQRTQFESDGRCFTAPDLISVKERIDRQLHERALGEFAEIPKLRVELLQANRRADGLEANLRTAIKELRQVEENLTRVGLYFVFIHRVWRPLRRWLAGEHREQQVIRMPVR